MKGECERKPIVQIQRRERKQLREMRFRPTRAMPLPGGVITLVQASIGLTAT